MISGIQPTPRQALEGAGKFQSGRAHFVATLDEALAEARARLGGAVQPRPAAGAP